MILAFFPGAFTSVCTKELCTFRDSLSRLKGLKAELVAISVNDPFTLKGFADTHNLQFPLLSDYTREVSRRYGGVHDDFAGLKGYTASKRAVFIIDRGGVVRYAWVSDNPLVEPNYEEITRELEKIE